MSFSVNNMKDQCDMFELNHLIKDPACFQSSNYSCIDNFYTNNNTFFFLLGFSLQTLTIHRAAGEGRGPSFIPSTTSTRSRTLRHLFATLHVRWLSRIFNCNACVYCSLRFITLSNYHLSDWLMMQCLCVYLMNWC